MAKKRPVLLFLDCEICGNRLSAHEGEHSYLIRPCSACLEKARDEGYSKGHEEGDEGGYDRAVNEYWS